MNTNPLPFWTRLSRRWRLGFRARQLSDYEFHFTYGSDPPDVALLFYVKRRPLRFDLFFPGQTGIVVKEVKYQMGSDLVPMKVAVTEEQHPEGQEIRIFPARILDVKKVVFTFEGFALQFESPRVLIQATKDIPKDLEFLQYAFGYIEKGEMLDSAIEDLKEYETYSTSNPEASYWLGEAYRKTDHPEQAAEYAIRSLVNFPSDKPGALYRKIQEDKPRTPTEDIRQLQKEAAQWTVDSHHGLMVLERRQHFWLGLNGWHLRKRREFIEVKRAAAGRFLNAVGFRFSGNEYLLFTTLRVINKDGVIEKVKDENFAVGESSDKNMFITVENEQGGTWILPDLHPGDVIDWEYHLICRDHGPEDDPEFFILTSAFDGAHPTFQSQNEFLVPRGLPVRLLSKNGELEESRIKLDHGSIEKITFMGSRFVPSKNTNFLYEDYFLNPILACSHRDTTWSEVSKKGLAVNFGSDEGETDLPLPLRDIVDGAENGTDALERAFYWTRDQLKYASLQSGIEQIGQSARAEKIVESGTGDCKDKSYLLSLVCKKFDIPFEYVAVSTKQGSLIEDVPGHQFDHVFIRAQTKEGWCYLDAANSMTSFGSPPAWCQGLKGMILDTEGSILTIPTDTPEANLLEITEVFDEAVDGWLRGTFEFRARGQSGRVASERVKGASLIIGDPQQAVQEGLGPYLPFIVVFDHSRISDTGSSNVFHMKGRHGRAPLASLEKVQKRVGRLSWNMPPLPVGYWRNLQLDRLFVMDFPLKINLKVTLRGQLFRRLDDVSHIVGLENDICRVKETVTENTEDITIVRELTFKERFVRGDRLKLVPDSMDALERALHLVLSFNER